MANNSNGGLVLTPIKALGYSITFTALINTAILWAISNMNTEIEQRTKDRYTSLNAEKDLRLRDFRLMSTEQEIQRCIEAIEEHQRFHRSE